MTDIPQPAAPDLIEARQRIDATDREPQALIIERARRAQQAGRGKGPLCIGYPGPEGTFSKQAMLKHFGHSAPGLPLATIDEVFHEVEAGHADFGVVPIENSSEGTVQSTLGQFLTPPLKVCGEIELRVHQHPLSRLGRLDLSVSTCA